MRREAGAADDEFVSRKCENGAALPEVRAHGAYSRSERHKGEVMNPNKIPVTVVKSGGATGTPEDFEQKFEKGRQRGGARRAVEQPVLKPLRTPSMQELMDRVNLES